MTWPQDAYVGQKVVCVDNKNYLLSTPDDNNYLEIGKIYTIGAIEVITDLLCFQIKEVNQEDEFLLASRFRPVQSTETGMSILKKLLVPTKEFERVG